MLDTLKQHILQEKQELIDRWPEHTTEYQAAQRYNIKAKKLFGSYAHLNALCLNTICLRDYKVIP